MALFNIVGQSDVRNARFSENQAERQTASLTEVAQHELAAKLWEEIARLPKVANASYVVALTSCAMIDSVSFWKCFLCSKGFNNRQQFKTHLFEHLQIIRHKETELAYTG